jgi:hypothetical protein
MKWYTIKTVLWSAIGGAMVWWIVLGFVWGWMPPGSAEQQAEARAEAALFDVLVPLCVAQFQQDAERATKLAALQKTNSWQRDDFVIKQGWATIPGDEEPTTKVAEGCAQRILTASSS